MLYSSNPDDIKLAAGIISSRQGGSEIVENVTELLCLLIDASTKMSARVWSHKTFPFNPDSYSKEVLAEALNDLNDQIIRLAKETWVDPIVLMTQVTGIRGAISVMKCIPELSCEDDLNAAL